MYKALILLCLAAVAFADVGYDGGKKSGYGAYDGGYGGHGYGGHGYAGHGYGYAYGANRHREAHVNYYNGLRQHAVNAAAEHYGAGTGTAKIYGVPGTYVGVHGHHGGHPKAAYGGY